MNTLFNVLFLFIQFLGKLLFDWWGWLVIVIWLSTLILINSRKQKWINDSSYSLLLIEVPKDNEKQALSAEQMFASLHGILRPKQELLREGAIQEHISFEIVSVSNRIQFYVWTPKHLRNFVEGQIYAQYPTVNIHEVGDDYAKHELLEDKVIRGAELTLVNHDTLPIRTFKSFEVDPLAGITAVLAKLEETGEQAWIQILARPVDDSWRNRGENYIRNVRDGKVNPLSGSSLSSLPFELLRNFFIALWQPPNEQASAKQPVELNEQQKQQLTAASEKISKLGYEVRVRLAHIGTDRNASRIRLQSLVGAFKQFNDTNNGFKVARYTQGEDLLKSYRARLFTKRGNVLNIEELASLYHLPHTNVETPSMLWATVKTAEPPANLPSIEQVDSKTLSPIGATNFRGSSTQFGLKRPDRGRHVYMVGQTGTGKSGLLELLTLSDIHYDEGFAVIDPHGDSATTVLQYIPERRIGDVIYFNAADTDYPIAFNPLEVTDPSLKGHISSEVVGALKRMFDYSWGPRLEYILRYTILALLDYPNATMLGITRMLTEKDFRKRIIKQVQDPVVKNFWINEYASWNEKFATEAVAPILNKVGAFVANPLVRNILGQPKSAMNIRNIMDEGKILLVNLSRGQVGEDNAAILGSLMVTKIQLAAMSRADIALIEDRRPFYLYVDEFQNFATDSFAVILSEARKYGLNLTIANQYVAQMSQEVRDAVFGNVGTMISFRIGADDAPYLAKYFAPVFEDQDLINLHNRHFVISMSLDGEKVQPFTATTLNLPPAQGNFTEQIINLSRQRFATPKTVVADKIARWSNFEILNGPDKQKPNTQTPRHTQQLVPAQEIHHLGDSDNVIQPDQEVNLRQ